MWYRFILAELTGSVGIPAGKPPLNEIPEPVLAYARSMASRQDQYPYRAVKRLGKERPEIVPRVCFVTIEDAPNATHLCNSVPWRVSVHESLDDGVENPLAGERLVCPVCGTTQRAQSAVLRL
jgi:hypothetical protein